MRGGMCSQKGKAGSSAAMLGVLLFALSLFLHLATAAEYAGHGDGAWFCTPQSQVHAPLSGEAAPAQDQGRGATHCNDCAPGQSPALPAPLALTGFTSPAAVAPRVAGGRVNLRDARRPGQALARAPPVYS
jgi:hypothetical protein